MNEKKNIYLCQSAYGESVHFCNSDAAVILCLYVMYDIYIPTF